jgi:hypothetical protein
MKKILPLLVLLVSTNGIAAHGSEDHKTTHVDLHNKTTKQLTFELLALIAQWHEPVNDITLENVQISKTGCLAPQEEKSVDMENAINAGPASPDWLVKQILVCTTAVEKKCTLYTGKPDHCGSEYEITENEGTLSITKCESCSHQHNHTMA